MPDTQQAPMSVEDQAILEQLLATEANVMRRRQNRPQAQIGPTGTAVPRDVAASGASGTASPNQTGTVLDEDPIPVRPGEVPYDVYAEGQRRLQAGTKDQQRYGVVDFEMGGKKYRYDKNQMYRDQGFNVDPGMGGFGNYMLRFAQDWTGQRRENMARQEVDQRQKAAMQMARQKIMSDEAYKQLALQEKYDELDAKDLAAALQRGVTRAGQLTTAAGVQAKVDAYGKRTEVMGRPKPANPVQEQQAAYWKARVDAIKAGKPLGPDAPRGGAAKQLNPMSALTKQQQLDELIPEAQSNLDTLDDEIQGKGLFNLAGNDDVTITVNGYPRKVRAANLKSVYAAEQGRMQRMKQHRDALQKVIEGGLAEDNSADNPLDAGPGSETDVPEYDPNEGDSLLNDDETPPPTTVPAGTTGMGGPRVSAGDQSALSFDETDAEDQGSGDYATELFHSMLEDLANSGLDPNDPVTQKYAYQITKDALAKQGYQAPAPQAP